MVLGSDPRPTPWPTASCELGHVDHRPYVASFSVCHKHTCTPPPLLSLSPLDLGGPASPTSGALNRGSTARSPWLPGTTTSSRRISFSSGSPRVGAPPPRPLLSSRWLPEDYEAATAVGRWSPPWQIHPQMVATATDGRAVAGVLSTYFICIFFFRFWLCAVQFFQSFRILRAVSELIKLACNPPRPKMQFVVREFNAVSTALR